MNTTIGFSIFESAQITKLTWTDNFVVLDQICLKWGIPVGNKISEYHHWILHIRINVGSRFQLKITILIFWTKFAQKGYFHFQSKTEKVNITIDDVCPKRVIPVEDGKIALVYASMVVTYYIKRFCTGANRHNGILMSLLFLVAETNIAYQSQVKKDTENFKIIEAISRQN